MSIHIQRTCLNQIITYIHMQTEIASIQSSSIGNSGKYEINVSQLQREFTELSKVQVETKFN